MKKTILLLIKIYRYYISPLKTGKCRFYPTCSEYAVQAVEKYGVAKGLFMTIRRIAKCHPFHPGGYDPLK